MSLCMASYYPQLNRIARSQVIAAWFNCLVRVVLSDQPLGFREIALDLPAIHQYDTATYQRPSIMRRI